MVAYREKQKKPWNRLFPGTNCEYDTAKAFARAGADPEILVVRNLTPADVTASCEALVKAIDNSQIVMLPGGIVRDGQLPVFGGFCQQAAEQKTAAFGLGHRKTSFAVPNGKTP